MSSAGLVCRKEGVEVPDHGVPRPICPLSRWVGPHVRFGHFPLDLRPMGVLWRDRIPFGAPCPYWPHRGHYVPLELRQGFSPLS